MTNGRHLEKNPIHDLIHDISETVWPTVTKFGTELSRPRKEKKNNKTVTDVRFLSTDNLELFFCA